jgi:hypothetical protein
MTLALTPELVGEGGGGQYGTGRAKRHNEMKWIKVGALIPTKNENHKYFLKIEQRGEHQRKATRNNGAK